MYIIQFAANVIAILLLLSQLKFYSCDKLCYDTVYVYLVSLVFFNAA